MAEGCSGEIAAKGGFDSKGDGIPLMTLRVGRACELTLISSQSPPSAAHGPVLLHAISFLGCGPASHQRLASSYECCAAASPRRAPLLCYLRPGEVFHSSRGRPGGRILRMTFGEGSCDPTSSNAGYALHCTARLQIGLDDVTVRRDMNHIIPSVVVDDESTPT